MAAAFAVIATLILVKHKHDPVPIFSLSALFFILGAVAPALLKPAYIFWMNLAFLLGWVNTKLILAVIFYFIITPIGLVMRIFGVDLLDRKTNRDKDTYWIRKDNKDFDKTRYQRQF